MVLVEKSSMPAAETLSDRSLKDAQTHSLCYERCTDSQFMLRKMHRLTVYATEEGV